MIAHRSLERANLIAKAIRDSGHEISSPWVLGPLEMASPDELNIFERDKGGVERSDAIVADCTDPSIGVGMEIMAAHNSGKRVIIVVKRDRITSAMLRHMEGKEAVEYVNESEIYPRLFELLARVRSPRQPGRN
jgi:hypothetical protein